MCFLTDPNLLYIHALGLYDLELTLLVAQQAQKVGFSPKFVIAMNQANYDKDPREYLPFLRKLQQLPELRKQFEIDNYLGRWAKALKSLHALRADDEVRSYTIKHDLYKDAIDYYKYQPEQMRDITHLYADYLRDQSHNKDAGIGKLLQTEYLSKSDTNTY